MPPGISCDQYSDKEKYYIFKNREGFKSYSHYFTINKELYERYLQIKKSEKLLKLIYWITSLSWFTLFISLILFGSVSENLWPIGLVSFIIAILFLVFGMRFEFKVADKWERLFNDFVSTPEYKVQKAQEELLASIKHQNELYEETKDIVETYNILDNKKLSKENKIRRLMNYIEKFKEKK